MDPDPELDPIVAALERDAAQLDREGAKQRCRALCELAYGRKEPVPFATAKGVLKLLQEKRWFDLEEQVAEVLIQAGQDALEIRRRLVQALIDQKRLSSAQAHLARLIPESAEDPSEHAEARGLLGRALKQRYVDAKAPEVPRNAWALQRAITTYGAAYQETATDPLWHGINLVACLARARRDGVKLPQTLPDHRELARTLLTLAKETFESKPSNVWAAATALEACVALGDLAGAMRWARTYAEHEKADAFEMGSTLRQLVEVWQLDAASGDVGPRVLPVLRAGLLKKENGSLEITPAEVHAEAGSAHTLQKVFGLESFVPFEWYTTGLERARAVARITNQFNAPVGTGFLVRARDLSPRFGDGWVVLTNHHVVSTEGRLGLRPDQARVTFQALAGDGARAHEIKEVLWSSPFTDFDVSILRLKDVQGGADTLDAYRIAGGLPELPAADTDAPERIYVIGHPFGGGLSFSIHDNLLLGCRDPLIHYRTPTAGGSSGSPVFNSDWELIGIHHSGDEHALRFDDASQTYEANEGISILSIREALQHGAPPA